MVTTLTPAETTYAKRMNWLGWGLITTAFAGTTLVAKGDSVLIGQKIVETFGGLLAVYFIVWLATRKRTELAKANGWVICGVFLCMVVVMNYMSDNREKVITKNWSQENFALKNRQQENLKALAERFQHVDLATVLTPENVTSPVGIAASRATLKQYRALLDERNLLLQKNNAENERLLMSIPPGNTKSHALWLEEAGQNTLKTYHELDQTQRAEANVMERILDWCEKQGPNLTLESAQLHFVSREQAMELQALLDELSAAEKASEEVIRATKKM